MRAVTERSTTVVPLNLFFFILSLDFLILVQFQTFWLRNKHYCLFRKSTYSSPFATRKFLLRAVRDRPVAFAAECGKAEDRLVLDNGCPVIC